MLSSFLLCCTAPGDYTSISTVLTFQPSGPTVMCVDIEIINDVSLENSESFFFVIPSQSDLAVTVSTPSSAIITISDPEDRKCCHIKFF